MERLDFTPFSNAVDAQFKKLTEQANAVLVRVDILGDDLYEKYLDAYPTEHNGIFRERREYDGNYDKNYIRRLGNVVSVTADGTVNTIWNVKVPSYFQDVADAILAMTYKAFDKNETREAYLKRCATNKIARVVKLHDATFNATNCLKNKNKDRFNYYAKTIASLGLIT